MNEVYRRPLATLITFQRDERVNLSSIGLHGMISDTYVDSVQPFIALETDLSRSHLLRHAMLSLTAIESVGLPSKTGHGPTLNHL